MGNKVFVIGLDGATLEIIRPLAEKGRLPNFSRLMKEGSFGILKSTIPPITPCAWTSFATGKDPSKHGLYDFNLHEGDPENTKSANRTFVKAKSLWRILSEAGKRSIVIDVPLTYPPEEINGYMISRVMAPQKKNCAYPKSLYRRLSEDGFIEKKEDHILEKHGIRKAGVKASAKKSPRRLNGKMLRRLRTERIRQNFKEIIRAIDKNMALCEAFMKREQWDFFMIVFMSADHAGHSFWHDKVKMRKIYQKLDEAIGEIFRLAGPETIKFIMSDHGFTSIGDSFNINEWLYDRGLLSKKIGIPYKDSMKELKKFLRQKNNVAGRRRCRKLKKFRYMLQTDYSKSKAYLQSGTSYGIRINLKGRDKAGIVEKGDYESFRNYLIKELKTVEHHMTGKKIFHKILKKEDVYSTSPAGTDPAPDIFLLSRDMKVMLEGQFGGKFKIFRKAPRGYGFHHTEGIFFAEGQKINRMHLDSAKITDLAPTILHILNVPIPEDMDGRVLNEIFTPNSDIWQRELSYQAGSAIDGSADEYSKKDESVIREKLAALGYV